MRYKNAKITKDEETKNRRKELPVYKKRQSWCFRVDGVLYKFPTKKEAEEKYLELTKKKLKGNMYIKELYKIARDMSKKLFIE